MSIEFEDPVDATPAREGWTPVPSSSVTVPLLGLDVNTLEELAAFCAFASRRLPDAPRAAFFGLTGAALAEVARDLRLEDAWTAAQLLHGIEVPDDLAHLMDDDDDEPEVI